MGLAIALLLQGIGFNVTIITKKLPGQGITGDKAAGIGCIFKASCELIRQWVLDSYPMSTRLARSNLYRAITPTRIFIRRTGGEHMYRNLVEGYEPIGTGAYYTTFSFEPALWCQEALAYFKANGGKVCIRSTTAEEENALRQGNTVPGYDYAILCAGLGVKEIIPDTKLEGILGILVHFKPGLLGVDAKTGLPWSLMAEEKCLYAISRLLSTGLGGTYYANIKPEDITEDYKLNEAKRIIQEVNAEFDLRFSIDDIVKITAGFRPGISEDAEVQAPLILVNEKRAVVSGLGGQGFVTWYAMSNYVVQKIMVALGFDYDAMTQKVREQNIVDLIRK